MSDERPIVREDLANSGLFTQVINRRYVVKRVFSAAQYRDLLGTFSNILGFEEPIRRNFLACIANLIEEFEHIRGENPQFMVAHRQ